MARVNTLIVEDEAIIAMDLKKRLEHLGYTVCATVATGADAIAQVFALQPDLILMDLVLKGEMDGIQAAAHIRAHTNVPVIYLTAPSDEHTLARAKVTEPDGYILKPFDNRELHATIEMALYKHAAEQKLRESEERFHALADAAPSLIWMMDAQGQCDFVNQPWLEFTGRTLAQEIGVGWTASLHPDDLERYGKLMATAFSAREPFACEYRLRRADGVYRWVMNKGMPRFSPNREFIGYIGSAMDVTEQRQARDELQYRLEWEKLVATISTKLVSLSPGQMEREITHILGVLGAFVHADRSYILQLSDDRGELNNPYEWCAPGIVSRQSHSQHIPVATIKWSADILRRFEIVHVARLADLPPTAQAEKQIMEAQATKSLLAVPLVYQNCLYGVLGLDAVRQEMQWADEDITLLKTVGEMVVNALVHQRSAEALRQNEERWRMYIEEANDLIFALDAQGRLILANRTVCRTLDCELSELLGRSPLDFVPAEAQPKVKHALGKIFSGNSIERLELPVVSCHGRRVWLEVRGFTFFEQGVLAGTFHIARDVTERRQTIMRLEYLSSHDTLTDLYNRTFFEEELKRLEHSRHFPVSIVMCDVNGLKATNDQLGHAAGDTLLRRAARVLTDAFRAEDIVARIGGDEFIVLLPNTDAAIAQAILARVRDQLTCHNAVESPPLSFALGCATGEQPGSLMQVLRQADEQMYRDKHGDEQAGQ